MLDYRHVYYQSDSGLKLYARHYQAESAPTVICMPGLTRNSADFDELCQHLRGQYNVYAMDFRGRGKSQWDTNSANYIPLNYATDLQALIRVEQLKDVTLIGTSLGGLVAMIYAARFDNSVRALVLNDIGPEINVAGLKRIQQYVGKPSSADNWEQATELVKSINADFFPDLGDGEWETMAKGLMYEAENGRIEFAYDPAISVNTAAVDDGPIPHLWAEFERLTDLPVLVLRGEFSDILDTACVRKMQAIHSGVSYCEVANRGHAPLLNEPQSVSSIRDFLPANSSDLLSMPREFAAGK